MGNEPSSMINAPSGKIRRVRRVVKPVVNTQPNEKQKFTQPIKRIQQNEKQQFSQPIQRTQQTDIMSSDIIQQRNMIDADSRSLIFSDRQQITADNYHDQQKKFEQRMIKEKEEFIRKQKNDREKREDKFSRAFRCSNLSSI